MKRIVFIILLFSCFVAPFGTCYFILQYQKKQVKRAVKWRMISGINRDELVLLKFTKTEKQQKLKWKHSREFEYNGEMYDIVAREEKGDTSFFWCWWDHEETKLNKQLKELVSYQFGKNPGKQENQKRFFNFFKTIIFTASLEKIEIAFFELNRYFGYKHSLYQSLSNPPPPPPP